MKQTLIILACLIFLIGCRDTTDSQNTSNEKLIIEQYFYSKHEDDLKKLANKLKTEGYQINDYRSYEHEGENEWYFYSSKEIKEDEINSEDIKSEEYAEEFNVGYDGHGFPIE
ncbi:ribonuclease E inhibitor RraB [Paenibacillus sp. Soil522]|uniref:ribonuclease E inhibitor RraB n=1 Tax=Paenibacillus sp. Soil522 TaxID=1736388 RepID=UPI0006FF0DE5|nr:ribonuclease E inhibitor RraB [Paenibacillus sp. Soil522]KRE30274.1 hypothetical protein ASG81_25375 [Paenibacillus sp. Soil522]